MKALRWNQRSPAYANGLEPLSSYMIVERGSAQAGRLTGFLNAVGDLGGIVSGGLH